MANRIPGELRKAATCWCLLHFAGEVVDLHETQLALQPTPYVLPSTAANYENVHVELEDYPPNGWDAQRVSLSDSSSGAMLTGDNNLFKSFYKSTEKLGYFLLV